MNIDCSIYCPTFLKMLNSCPSIHLPLSHEIFGSEKLFEIFMVLLSTSPYVTSFLFVISSTYFKTTRSVMVLLMIFIQNFIVEFLKNALRDPRPNYECNKQFGNPSNHATFFSSLITWMIMEYIILDHKHRFSQVLFILLLIAAFPFIIYSRIYLKYHSFEQISNGVLLGVVVGVCWFIIVDNFILKVDNPLRRILQKLGLRNNMSDIDILSAEHGYKEAAGNGLYAKYLQLSKKQDELSKIKNELKTFRSTVETMDIIKKRVDLCNTLNKHKID